MTTFLHFARLLLVVVAGAACSSTNRPTATEPGPGPKPGPGDISVWLTTADARKLLQQQTDITFGAPNAASVATIEVDESQAYQEIVGFGAAITGSSAWLIHNRMSETQRDALLRELFGRDGGLGFSFTRLPMGASDFSIEHYSYDDVPAGQTDPTLAHFSIDVDRPYILPVVKQALAINPQLKVMASPWSAPAWMKTTGNLYKGTLRPEAYGPLAEYFRKFIAAYAAEGVPIWAITVQNEPHFEPENYPGMRLEPPQRAEFLKNHIGPLFSRSGIRTLILDWDHNWDQPESPMAVLNDAAAKQYVGGIAWHCYAGEVSAQSRVHEAHPDKDAFFTECSGGQWSPDFANNLKYFVGTLVIGTTRNWARGVLLWNLALDAKYGPHKGGCGDCRGVVTVDSTTGAVTRNVEYYALGHASKFVHPGARRIASNSGAVGLESVAFRNADDGSKVLIVLNTATEARTFDTRTAGRSFTYTLPAGAAATFRWP
jgi:glucosylceramidase